MASSSSKSSSSLQLSSAITMVGRERKHRIQVANIAVQRASTVLFPTIKDAWAAGDPANRGEPGATTYGTVGTETTFALCEALEQIEGAGAHGPHAVRAAVQPSGLAAITTALQAFLVPGDTILMMDTVYGPARAYALEFLSRWGVSTTFFDPTVSADHPNSAQSKVTANTKVLYLESPSSYTFEIPDIPALCSWARAKGLVSMVDNAWASPMMSHPFDWGVDVSLIPLTKYWSGHSDVLMGAVVVREPLWQQFWSTQRASGICVSSDDAYMILRGLRTASVRMKQASESALVVAQWLRQQPQVGRILHPALPEHPQHALFKRDFLNSSGLFSFEIKREFLNPQHDLATQMSPLCDGRRHFGIGYSWAGFESLIMPARIDSLRTTNRWIGGPLVRLNIGLEDPRDLIEDLAEGFKAMGW